MNKLISILFPTFLFASITACVPTFGQANGEKRPELFSIAEKFDKDGSYTIEEIERVTGHPLHRHTAGWLVSDESPKSTMFQVESAVNASGQSNVLVLVNNPDEKIGLETVKNQFGRWSSIDRKPKLTWPENKHAISYVYDRPWGDMTFEFEEAKPPFLRSIQFTHFKAKER